jgi:beta-glucosidase
MKKVLKFILYLLLFLIVLIAGGIAYWYISANISSSRNMAQLGPEAPVLNVDGLAFRDLNKNGALDVYEDFRQPIDARIEDILKQMTVEEKAGMMFHTFTGVHPEGKLTEAPVLTDFFTWGPSNSTMVVKKKMNHFNIFGVPNAKATATWYNNLQKLAERTRLGIPVTLSSDPRNHIMNDVAVAMFGGDYSLWPEPLGMAATQDSLLVYQFGDIARQEYLATGIRVALHPMADLATEPRWPRINGTFGEDAKLSATMTYAYIKGFQGDSLSNTSVACMTKHFSGGGPQKEGLDPHFKFQKGQVYPGGKFDYHLIPFEAAFAAGTAQIMPYYGIPMDQTSENVGFSFNKEIITGLLREKYQFDGVVCTDWGLISDAKVAGMMIKEAADHGVENLTKEEKLIKAIDAGVDQFGGEDLVEMFTEIIKSGKISEERINQSIRRLLRDKFRLGLFDNPYVDADQAARIVGKKEFMEAGKLAQRKSIVLLKNKETEKGTVLPLSGKPKIFVLNIDKNIASQYGEVVNKPEEADFAIVRTATPYEPYGDSFLEKLFHHGSLDFKDPEKSELLKLMETVPTILNVYLDRPAVMPELAEKAAGLLVNFGAQDDAVLDVIFGKFNPSAKLPIELPSSMEAVRNQKEDVPYDSKDPLYPFGFGLSYPEKINLNR